LLFLDFSSKFVFYISVVVIPPRRISIAMFSLLSRKKPKPPEATPAPRRPRGKLLADLEHIESLPHLSDTAVQAMNLVNSPDASLSDMVNVIRRDGMVAAAVIKLANSAVYRASGEVTDLQQAVVRIGFRGTGNLISGIGMKSLYDRHPPIVQSMCQGILRHSLFTANLSSGINRAAQIGLQGEEFTSGLLHDVGRIVISVKAMNELLSAGIPEYDQAEDLLAREREAFGTDHCSLGGLFAVQNQLPKRVGRVILNHHNPCGEQEFRDLLGLVMLADSVANHIEVHRNVTGFEIESNRGYQTLRGVIDAGRLKRLTEILPRTAVQAVKDTRAMLKSMYS
jgi:HD-like signal output (HDOD) protein